MTSTDTEGLVVGAYLGRDDPRDALCGADRPGRECGSGRRPPGAARSCSPSSPALVIEPLRATSTRACANAVSVDWTRSCWRAAGSTGSGSATRSAAGSIRRRCCRRPGRGAGAPGSGGEEELVAARRHGETRRRVEAERRCVFAVGGGCLAPVAAYHDGSTLRALVADEDGAWIERGPRGPRAFAAELVTARGGARGR